MIARTWPYGTQRRATVIRVADFFHVLTDDQNEGHVLDLHGAADNSAKVGDHGTLTFTQGGPPGGYWKFVKDKK